MGWNVLDICLYGITTLNVKLFLIAFAHLVPLTTLIIRGAHRDRTLRNGRYRSMITVPVPLKVVIWYIRNSVRRFHIVQDPGSTPLRDELDSQPGTC